MNDSVPHPAAPGAAALARVQQAVLSMPMARTLGLRFVHLAPGQAELELPVLDAFCFTPGQLQATALFAAGDFAAVSAAGTLMESPDEAVSTIDGHLKLLAPARGAQLRAVGRVVHASGQLLACAADVFAVDAQGRQTLCATWLGTARRLRLAARAA